LNFPYLVPTAAPKGTFFIVVPALFTKDTTVGFRQENNNNMLNENSRGYLKIYSQKKQNRRRLHAIND
jgi:hypothetical protein